MCPIVAGHDDSAVGPEASGTLDVVHVALLNILCCHHLQQIANTSSPFANDVRGDLGRRRHAETYISPSQNPQR